MKQRGTPIRLQPTQKSELALATHDVTHNLASSLRRELLGQDESVTDELGRLMGLSQMQQGVITDGAMQGKGRALWMVGDQRYKVQTLLTPLEEQLTYTQRRPRRGYLEVCANLDGSTTNLSTTQWPRPKERTQVRRVRWCRRRLKTRP